MVLGSVLIWALCLIAYVANAKLFEPSLYRSPRYNLPLVAGSNKTPHNAGAMKASEVVFVSNTEWKQHRLGANAKNSLPSRSSQRIPFNLIDITRKHEQPDDIACLIDSSWHPDSWGYGRYLTVNHLSGRLRRTGHLSNYQSWAYGEHSDSWSSPPIFDRVRNRDVNSGVVNNKWPVGLNRTGDSHPRPMRGGKLFGSFIQLALQNDPLQYPYYSNDYRSNGDYAIWFSEPNQNSCQHRWPFVLGAFAFGFVGYFSMLIGLYFLTSDERCLWRGGLLIAAGGASWWLVFIFGHKAYGEPPGKYCITKTIDSSLFLYYTNYMANVLNTDKQIAVIGSLAEGSSIRSIERATGVHRDTIMRLGVRVGQGCKILMDRKMRDLPCECLELDEIWGFIGKKDRHVRPGDDLDFGNVWTFCAIDADTKLVPSFHVGKDRDQRTAKVFMLDLASRMKNRVQISTDGLKAYVDAVDYAFGNDVDYGQIVKTYGTVESTTDHRRYSAPEIIEIEKKVISGRPNFDLISTSYIERLNGTTRQHMKRLARLTYAFSKKRENFDAAVALHFAYYNFVRRHSTTRCTPAMAAGIEQSYWSVGDLVEAAA